jgi:hypothetical protein
MNKLKHMAVLEWITGAGVTNGGHDMRGEEGGRLTWWCERTTTLGPWRRRRRAASLSVRPASSAVPSRRSTSSSSPVSCNIILQQHQTRHHNHNHTSRWLDQRSRNRTGGAERTHQVRHGHIIRRRHVHVRAALLPSRPVPLRSVLLP